MSNAIKSLMIFAVGGAVGSVTTWIFVKKKYERIAQEEIDSVKEVFARRKEEEHTEPVEEPEPFEPTEEELEENLELVGQYYTVTDDTLDYSKPYVIPPTEFGEKEGYDEISLVYYADNILVDDDNTLLEDVENVVGFDSLTHFGEYEDDSVFVRNDRLKCDYEILLDLRKYSDVLKQKPYLDYGEIPMEE